MKRIGVTGYAGRLGSALVGMGAVPIIADITNPEELRQQLQLVKPDVIINCAAKTNVDACETAKYHAQAYSVGVRGLVTLQELAEVPIIQISTSYVFNGHLGLFKSGGYRENDKLDPVGGYGFVKFAAETVFLSRHSPDAKLGDSVVRTVGLYGSDVKPDFASHIVWSLRQGQEITALQDVKSNMTYVYHLAAALIALAEMDDRDRPKILHLASTNSMSRFEFAEKVAEQFGLDKSLLKPIQVKDFDGWVAPRPPNASLNTTLARSLDLPLYSVEEGLKAYERDGINHRSVL